MFQAFQQMGIMALLSLVVAIIPAAMGTLYAVRPSEARLALMRPLSLAGLFGGLGGFTAGLINALHYVSEKNVPLTSGSVLVGLAESLVPLAVSFASLTVGWLLVALGLRRQA